VQHQTQVEAATPATSPQFSHLLHFLMLLLCLFDAFYGRRQEMKDVYAVHDQIFSFVSIQDKNLYGDELNEI